MTAPKWTPGPWVLGNENEYCADVSAGRVSFGLDRTDACSGQAPVISRDEMLANAHLIAAAPELYSALEALLTHDSAAGPCDVPGLKCDCYERARAALKRARGE